MRVDRTASLFASTPNQSTGLPRWLQIDSTTNSVNPLYIPMSPRQQLTPAPYAIATTVGNLSGTLPTAQLSGSVLNSQLAIASIPLRLSPRHFALFYGERFRSKTNS